MTPSELNYCYRVLELKPGATLEVVDQAYKDLAFIWHPDRIPEENQRLRKIAEEKLKEINQARDKLRSILKRNTTSQYKATPQHSTTSSTRHSATGYSASSTQTQAKTYSHPTTSTTPRPSQSVTQPKPQPTPQTDYPPKTPYERPSAPDMSGVDLKGADLKERDFSGRNLTGADLSHANLSDAFLHKVNLNGACLSGRIYFGRISSKLTYVMPIYKKRI